MFKLTFYARGTIFYFIELQLELCENCEIFVCNCALSRIQRKIFSMQKIEMVQNR